MTITTPLQFETTQRRINELEKEMLRLREAFAGDDEVLGPLLFLHLNQLNDLRAEIEEYLGFREIAPAAYEIRYGMGTPIAGRTTLSALGDVISNFRGAVTALARKMSPRPTKALGKPKRTISQMLDFQVVGAASGSFRLFLEPPSQQPLGGLDNGIAERAFELLESAVAWVGSNDTTPPPLLAREELRHLALRQVLRLSPSGSGQLAYLEISRPVRGRMVHTRFDPLTFQRSRARLEVSGTATLTTHKGYLREVDLDKNTFELRDKPKGRKLANCQVPEDLAQDALGYAVSERLLLVKGEKRGTKLHVITMEPAEPI